MLNRIYLIIAFALGAIVGFGISSYLRIPSAATQPMPTERELQQWSQEVNKEVDNYRISLSPEQRAQFDKEVGELATRMEKMSETERAKFIDDTLKEQEKEQEQPKAQEQPTTSEVVAESPEIPAQKTIS